MPAGRRLGTHHRRPRHHCGPAHNGQGHCRDHCHDSEALGHQHPCGGGAEASYTRAEVEAIIRQVWPDDLENEAVRIATRESNLIPGVRNYCCFGLFQLYYNVHKTWLAQMGVTSAEQLYDPLINSYVAYAMYLKAGGWGPWKL